MQDARTTLKKIFTETLRREGGDTAPLLAWPIACGATVASKTSALSYRDGVLAIEVPDAAWRTELQALSARYVAAVNQISTHQVARIEFLTPNARQRLQLD